MALNEEQPEEIEDLLSPDYEGMKKFQPVINKFREVFLDGYEIDPECEPPKTGRGRGTRGGGTTARGGKVSAKSSQATVD